MFVPSVNWRKLVRKNKGKKCQKFQFKAHFSDETDDVILTDSQLEKMFGDSSESTSNSMLDSGMLEQNFQWEKGLIPYKLSPLLNQTEKKLVKESVQEVNDKMSSCIHLRYQNIF